MKRRILSAVLAAVLVLGLAACGSSKSDSSASGNSGNSGSSGSDEKPITVILYSPNSGNFASQAVEVMAQRLTQESGGKIIGNCIGAGSAGTQDEAVQAMMSGDMQIIVNTVDQLENQMPGCGNWLSWPFIFDSEAQAEEAWDNGGWMLQRVKDQAAEGGVHVFNYIYSGFKTFAFNKPVHSFADWQGMKVRVPNTALFLDLIARYGCQSVSGIDPYTSLQNGTVDGIYFGEEGHQTFKLEEVMTTLVMTHDTYGSNLYTCSEAWWNSLSAEQQELIDKIVMEVSAEYNQKSKDSIADYVKGLEERGIDIVYPDDAWINEMKKATISFWEEKLADDTYDADFREKLRTDVYEVNYADVLK